METTINSAKKILDDHIAKQRTHMYKPIQIAEILYHHRLRTSTIDFLNLETYRTASKRWRDLVTLELIGRVSTSSSKFQDDLFNESAISPRVLHALGKENIEKNGIVESYIYHRFQEKLGNIYSVWSYLEAAKNTDFRLTNFFSLFDSHSGLKKSVDKIYEIVVYSLFYTIIHHLKVEVQLTIRNPNAALISDFQEFTKVMFNLDSKSLINSTDANVYRVGVTNAADKGLDMWSNFGPIIQVKHLNLTENLGEEIANSVRADQMVIVCKEAERHVISSLLSQIGWKSKIQGIVTEKQLVEWYDLCFSKYCDTLGETLLNNIKREFNEEFPSNLQIIPFMTRREYLTENLTGIWKIS